MPSPVCVQITRIAQGEKPESCEDEVAAEEPLEIRVEGQSIAVVMRTPGEDRELAAGFLFRRSSDIFEITHCAATSPAGKGNVIDVLLMRPNKLDLSRLSRHVFTSSSCGICSRNAIQTVTRRRKPFGSTLRVKASLLQRLPGHLKSVQESFHRTGGAHACALFQADGSLVAMREDVGRHNALDKLVGLALLEKKTPLNSSILLLSGRSSFEMVQKAYAAGIPLVAAIGAPSSLAVELARQTGQTLVGFLRRSSMNIYTGSERIEATG